MQMDKLSDDWLFGRHAKQTIKTWLRQLNYFYFVRAWGGHANDGDAFKVRFIYNDKQDLTDKLKRIGIILTTIPDNFPRPVIGQPYPAEEFDKFKSEIGKYPNLEQPGYSILFGYQVFVWVYDNTFEVSVAGTKDDNRYEVTAADFRVCVDLEKHFDRFGWQQLIDRALEQSVCCVSKTKYPELYDQ